MAGSVIYSKPISMDKTKSTIDGLSMEPATNGVIISYTEKTKKPGTEGRTYDDCSYSYKKEVYDIDDTDDGESDLEKAWTRFRELWMRQYNEMKS